ncbi:MAG: hypothetical protein KF856_00725 [Cyclobacteriaceae bacterium]|nr:hypothetical protein [Cyclobacteriaceae bacterium]
MTNRFFNLHKTCWALLGAMLVFANTNSFAQEDNYAAFGIGYQVNALKTAYLMGNTKTDDFAAGIIVSFTKEQYDEGAWHKMDASGLLMGGLAGLGIMKTPGPRLRDWEDRKAAGEDSRFLFNDKFLYGQLAWSPGKQNFIGPTLQAGFEGIGVAKADSKGNGNAIDNGIGGGEVGALSFGTGLNIFEPFKNLADHSRLTLSYDWFLKRDVNDKFGLGGRKRITVEASAVVNRRFTLTAYAQFFDYKESFFYNDNATLERVSANSVITTFGVVASFNWLHWD